MSGARVERLQYALVAVGALADGVDGDFGPETLAAVRCFQWSMQCMPCRIETKARTRTKTAAKAQVPAKSIPIELSPNAFSGVIDACTPTATMSIDGEVSDALMTTLVLWQRQGWMLASPLVRLRLARFSHLELSPGFRLLGYPDAAPGEMLVHQHFIPAVELLDHAAGQAAVRLLVNQSFRVSERAVHGAVVRPAARSQHLVGRALDLNIVDGGVVNTSAMFLAGRQTADAQAFVDACRQLGLRWGGDFHPADPPHFDLYAAPDTDEYAVSLRLAQRSFASGHPLRAL